MKKYIVLVERLNSKFGSLVKGDKFFADEKDGELVELISNSSVESCDVEACPEVEESHEATEVKLEVKKKRK